VVSDARPSRLPTTLGTDPDQLLQTSGTLPFHQGQMTHHDRRRRLRGGEDRVLARLPSGFAPFELAVTGGCGVRASRPGKLDVDAAPQPVDVQKAVTTAAPACIPGP
jgi:hypothetical protein